MNNPTNKLTKLLGPAVSLFLALSPVLAAAKVVFPTIPGTPVPGRGNMPLTMTEIEGIFGTIGHFFVIVAPIILIITIVYGGILFMTAGASGSLVTKAKTTIGYGIVGGLIVFGVGVIINTLVNIVTRQFFCTLGINIPGIINICIF